MKHAIKPEYETYYRYLEILRQSGKTNMFGACPYLEAAQPELCHSEAVEILCSWPELCHSEAVEILCSWMDNYQEITDRFCKDLI